MPLILFALWLLAAGEICAAEGVSAIVVIVLAVVAAILALLAYTGGGAAYWRRGP